MRKLSGIGTVAIAMLLAACAAGPSAGPRAGLKEGWELLVARKNAEARDHYKSLLAEYPDNPYVHLNLGVAYQRLGQGDLARQHYAAAVKYGGDAPITRVAEEEGVVSSTGTVAERAQQNLQSTTSLDTPNPPGLNNELEEGWELMVKERYAAARDFYQGMLARYPGNPYIHLNLGVAFQRLGQDELARQHHRAAIANGGEAYARLPALDGGGNSPPGVRWWRETDPSDLEKETIAATPKITIAELARQNLDAMTN